MLEKSQSWVTNSESYDEEEESEITDSNDSSDYISSGSDTHESQKDVVYWFK